MGVGVEMVTRSSSTIPPEQLGNFVPRVAFLLICWRV